MRARKKPYLPASSAWEYTKEQYAKRKSSLYSLYYWIVGKSTVELGGAVAHFHRLFLFVCRMLIEFLGKKETPHCILHPAGTYIYREKCEVAASGWKYVNSQRKRKNKEKKRLHDPFLRDSVNKIAAVGAARVEVSKWKIFQIPRLQ